MIEIIVLIWEETMGFLRNVLIVVNDDNEKYRLLDDIPGWKYISDYERAEGWFDFTLVNKKENLFVVFKKIKDCVYRSGPISQYQVNGRTDVKEPQENDIHKDILFKLCMDIKEKYENGEVWCGIIPCEEDKI